MKPQLNASASWSVLLLLLWPRCGGGGQGPTAPTGPQSFLDGHVARNADDSAEPDRAATSTPSAAR